MLKRVIKVQIATKICGLNDQNTLDVAISNGASHIGFVFFAKSPRNLSFAQAKALAARVPSHVKKVGVFVDPDNQFIDEAVAAAALDIIQLHGSETPERVKALKERTGLIVWKAIPVRTAADIETASIYQGAADLLLFDAKPPKGADLPGGLGLRFDWRLLQHRQPVMPWGLSGGLDPLNVTEAIGISGARMVDISSGVEDAPGIKSAQKIKAFLKAVKEA